MRIGPQSGVLKKQANPLASVAACCLIGRRKADWLDKRGASAPVRPANAQMASKNIIGGSVDLEGQTQSAIMMDSLVASKRFPVTSQVAQA